MRSLIFAFYTCCCSIVFASAGFAQEKDLTQYVDPFIGTEEMGHTFPGACAPFGMVQLSPDTDSVQFMHEGKYNKEVYRYCAGYQYKDKSIVGFSHTHLSGTGHSDLGDFLIMPTVGKVHYNPGTIDDTSKGYRSMFRKETEKAEPGYYTVELDDYKVKAELTATQRVGFHQYTFPSSDESHIVLDLTHGIYNYDGKVLWSTIRVENDTLVTGYRITRGWARSNYQYFAMSFSKPIESYACKNNEKVVYNGFWRKFDETKNFPEMAGKALTANFNFTTKEKEKIKVKFALSAVSTEGALKNLKAEVPHFNFEQIRQETKAKWNKELNRIKIAASEEKKTTFYTSMYHSFINPIEYMDVDGKYRGLDHNIHQAEGFTNYTVFSLWDTYRAQHPLLSLIQPKRSADMINSMLAHYEQSVHKILPIWSHFGNENWCMIGYHAVPVIADALVNGLEGVDKEKALEACIASANYEKYDGIGDYLKYAYVPYETSNVGASITLEYSYDDWTIAQLAKSMGKSDLEKEYLKRSENWRNLFDDKTGYVRAKYKNGEWVSPFDPLDTHAAGFIEGNSWNYSLYVPQNVSGLVSNMGGEERFSEHLDSLFTMHIPDKYFAHNEDITREGIMGGYVHGNEPSHHVAYMYNWANKPWKTQERINQIMTTKYLNKPDGLCGNDDCGQMSAWYIFSSLGFYPVCPGSGQYAIGTPSINKAVLNLENGKTFTIKTENYSAKNTYIKSVMINGEKWNKSFINHSDIVNGGELIFKMSKYPNKKWATGPESKPKSTTHN
ncbi:glycoside hydrolase family 92 protein [Marinifilum sp. N1E240]|uniref:GH92 family glycosyl hydrolase n=1 Tax=Marinifilum sp. N1E240 TaxID=2608082 RepID=UPI00128D5E5E|nr:GH92 family glycosyl hydrolase [Marinifilum sp. N1E240]MPQ47458.1 glycoside hydrolase family 92 protein [Marinifilum sp. N1E240]